MKTRAFALIVAAWVGAAACAPAQTLQVSAPQERQVFQRNAHDTAAVRIAGQLATPAQRIEARAAPQPGRRGQAVDWTTVVNAPSAGAFTGTLTLAAGGWYWLELRAIRNGAPAEFRRVERVGVGEVFLASGQSNSVNFGEVRTQSQSDMVSAFDGATWSLANDPIPGSHDGSTGGSPYPKLGDKLVAALGVPVAFAITGHGGQGVERWLAESGSGLYEFLRARALALREHPPRCLLWHQGESNSWPGAPYSSNYAATLTTIINRLNADIGYNLRWMTCQATYIPGAYPNPTSTVTRAQQQLLWDTGTTLRGPDTDTLGPPYRHSGDGIHFNLAGLEAFAQMYFESIMAAFAFTAATPTPTPTRPPGCVLVSAGKPATAGSVFAPAYGAEKINDDRIGLEDSRWVSAAAGPHWCAIDLGQQYELCAVEVYSDETFTGSPLWNLTAYTVRASATGAGSPSDWAVVATFDDPCGPPYPDYPGSGVNARNTHAVAATARYVALVVTGGDGECGAIARVQELRIFGAPPTTPTPTPTATATFTATPSATPTAAPVVSLPLVEGR